MTPTTGLKWIKSSRSWHWQTLKCVELATLPDGGIAVRDSKNPDRCMLTVPRAAGLAFIQATSTESLR
jgi:uncharacterized protein DUF397